MYDTENIFAKILRGEIPCDKVYEDDVALAFHDISPQAPTHVLVIPKGEYINMTDFTTKASADEVSGFFQAVGKISNDLQIDQAGYRMISNCGLNGGQEVPHFHVHLLAGRPLGRMVAEPKAENA